MKKRGAGERVYKVDKELKKVLLYSNVITTDNDTLQLIQQMRKKIESNSTFCFKTHKELDEFVKFAITVHPLFTSSQDYAFLKGFDRAFWLKHQSAKKSENIQKDDERLANCEPLMVTSSDRCLCPFNSTQEPIDNVNMTVVGQDFVLDAQCGWQPPRLNERFSFNTLTSKELLKEASPPVPTEKSQEQASHPSTMENSVTLEVFQSPIVVAEDVCNATTLDLNEKFSQPYSTCTTATCSHIFALEDSGTIMYKPIIQILKLLQATEVNEKNDSFGGSHRCLEILSKEKSNCVILNVQSNYEIAYNEENLLQQNQVLGLSLYLELVEDVHHAALSNQELPPIKITYVDMVERKAKFKVEVYPELCDWTRKGKRIKVLSIQKNMMKRQIVVTCHVPRKQVQDSIALDVVSSIKDNDRYEYETYLDEKYPNQYSFIARGGFGHVYKVYDNSIGKDIAVKFMKYGEDAYNEALRLNQ